MSARELSRVEVLSRVKARTLSLRSAATLLAVSYRQAKRLAQRYRADGAKGLKHRSAGRPSNHARPTAERERALTLVRHKYSGTVDERFGPTLAAEHLASEDGVTVHHDTLRRWSQRDRALDCERPSAPGRLASLVAPRFRLSHNRLVYQHRADLGHQRPDTSPSSTLISEGESVSPILAGRACRKIFPLGRSCAGERNLAEGSSARPFRVGSVGS